MSKKKFLSSIFYLLSSIFGLTLSAFFWLPALWEGKYTLRDIVTKNQILGFENFGRLVSSAWNYGGTGMFSVQLGILQWLAIIFTPILIYIFWKRKNKVWIFLLFLFFCCALAIFLILPSSEGLYLKISFLQKFQFAWRFLSLVIFPPAVFAGALLYLIPKKFQNVFLVVFTVSCLFLNKDYWHAQAFLYQDESFYTGIYNSTTDTGESAPRWSVRFMEHRAKAPIEVINGQAKIKELTRTSTRHTYDVRAEQQTRLRENTLYFPGWVVLVDNQPVSVEFQDPQNRGLMTFFVETGNHNIVVYFGHTKLRLLAEIISLVSLVMLLFLSILKGRNLWQRFQLS